jgi:Tol biopolymer transport system component
MSDEPKVMSHELKVHHEVNKHEAIERENTHHPSLITRHFSRFDLVVLAVMAVLLGGIGVTLLLGDQVGVTLQRVGPLGTARSTSRMTIQFSEAMNHASVEERFHTEPEITGVFSWSGSTLIFQPDAAMTPGQEVNVVLQSGPVSETGREVLSDYRYTFTVRRPLVAYLYPSDNPPQNIWIADPADPSSARQVTFSPSGIYDFAVSPDGSQIAFSESNAEAGTDDIKLYNLESGALEQLTNCADASCTTPVWRPDGSMIVYQRIDFNSDMAQQGVGNSPPRLWVLDLTSRPVQTRPLFSDLQILGSGAQWSADGSKITLFDIASFNILIYDFTQGSTTALPTTSSEPGSISPDGTRIVHSELTQPSDGFTIRPYLILSNLSTNEQTLISDVEQGYGDSWPRWRPDGQALALARRDPSFSLGDQIMLYDPATGEQERLTDDPRYSNSFFRWDATGAQLVIQRFPLFDENMQPNNDGQAEIWTLDVATRTLTKVAANGFIPQWVP